MRNILNNKKGAEMTVGTIIIIILALVVLVFLIFSFTRSGGSLLDNIKNFFGGSSNVDSIKNACQAACVTKSSYEYNTIQRTVKFDGSTQTTASCKDLESTRSAQCTTPDGKVVLLDPTVTDFSKALCLKVKTEWITKDSSGNPLTVDKQKCQKTLPAVLNGGLAETPQDVPEVTSSAQCNVIWSDAIPSAIVTPCSEF